MMIKTSSLSLPRIATTLALASSALLFTACGDKKESAAPAPAPAASSDELSFETAEQKVSYGVGYNIGRDMGSQPALQIDQQALIVGLTDALSQRETRLSDTELQEAFMAVQKKVAEAMAKEGEKNLEAGNAFLAENKQRDGVTETESGLQYEVLESGSGPKATAEDTVKVNYHGTLIDGTVFDSSVDRGEPVEFPVAQVIPGWTEALQLMSVGDKWKLYVPAKLAYGPQSRPTIPAQSALIFEVELLEIK